MCNFYLITFKMNQKLYLNFFSSINIKQPGFSFPFTSLLKKAGRRKGKRISKNRYLNSYFVGKKTDSILKDSNTQKNQAQIWCGKFNQNTFKDKNTTQFFYLE